MEVLAAYIGRDNEERLQLLQGGSLVTAGAVTRAVLKFSGYCIDTDVDSGVIYFSDSDNQVLCLKLGMVDDIAAGTYRGAKLTLYDVDNTNGIAWTDLVVAVKPWNVCPA